MSIAISAKAPAPVVLTVSLGKARRELIEGAIRRGNDNLAAYGAVLKERLSAMEVLAEITGRITTAEGNLRETPADTVAAQGLLAAREQHKAATANVEQARAANDDALRRLRDAVCGMEDIIRDLRGEVLPDLIEQITSALAVYCARRKWAQNVAEETQAVQLLRDQSSRAAGTYGFTDDALATLCESRAAFLRSILEGGPVWTFSPDEIDPNAARREELQESLRTRLEAQSARF